MRSASMSQHFQLLSWLLLFLPATVVCKKLTDIEYCNELAHVCTAHFNDCGYSFAEYRRDTKSIALPPIRIIDCLRYDSRCRKNEDVLKKCHHDMTNVKRDCEWEEVLCGYAFVVCAEILARKEGAATNREKREAFHKQCHVEEKACLSGVDVCKQQREDGLKLLKIANKSTSIAKLSCDEQWGEWYTDEDGQVDNFIKLFESNKTTKYKDRMINHDPNATFVLTMCEEAGSDCLKYENSRNIQWQIEKLTRDCPIKQSPGRDSLLRQCRNGTWTLDYLDVARFSTKFKVSNPKGKECKLMIRLNSKDIQKCVLRCLDFEDEITILSGKINTTDKMNRETQDGKHDTSDEIKDLWEYNTHSTKSNEWKKKLSVDKSTSTHMTYHMPAGARTRIQQLNVVCGSKVWKSPSNALRVWQGDVEVDNNGKEHLSLHNALLLILAGWMIF
uniref:Uncharacterized protein n=1 Tax=Ditylenchus dipsaci TaxID=166011 RepID=A0A915DSE1_9BILA